MASISSINSDSTSTLFSSLSFSTSTSSSSSTSDILGIDYSDWYMIKNGTYKSLMKAYYDSQTSSSTQDTTVQLTSIKSQADALSSATSKLLDTSLWEKVETTDEDGNVTKDYDWDKISSAVSDWVDAYNDMIESAGNSNTTSVLRAASNMVSYVQANSSVLEKMGITIGSDNKLSFDEDAMKESSNSIASMKALFGSGYGSFGSQISYYASQISSAATTAAATASSYSSDGNYTYNYVTGELVDDEA